MADKVSKVVVMETLNPPWEPKDPKIHWKQIGLLILTAAFYALFLFLGYYVIPDSNLPEYFSDTVRIIEFTGWFVSLFFYIEIVQVALYKTKADKRYLAETKQMQPYLHKHHNRSFAVGFFLVFLFYIVRLGANWVFNFDIEAGNIFKALDGLYTPWETLFGALLAAGGFGAYAQYLFIFERVALGHRKPIFWVIPVVGILMVIFAPYDTVVFDLQVVSGVHFAPKLFDVSLVLAWVGAAIVPLGFLVLYKRYKFHNPEYARECKDLWIGFLLISIATWFSINHQIYFAGLAPVVGGLPYFFEVFFSMFLGPLCNFAGVFFVRRSFYSGGRMRPGFTVTRQAAEHTTPGKVEYHAQAKEEPKNQVDEDIRKKRLHEIAAVSDRIAIQRLAILLNITPEDCRLRAAAWAKQFNIHVSGEDIVFNPETLDAFIIFIDAQFRK